MRASGTLLMVLLAAAARAEDAAPAPADSIAAAKRDLAAIKSPLSPQETGALPLVDMKDLGPMPGGLRPEVSPLPDTERDPSLGPNKKKVGTGNWLVDAMDKNTSSKEAGSKEKDDILKGDPDLIRADEKGVRLEKDPLAPDEPREKEQPKPSAQAVYNPLDSFMGSWISARDHDLLLTPARSDGIAGPDSGKTRADLLPGIEVNSSQPSEDFVLPQPDPTAFGDPRSPANPYVAVMDLLPASPLASFAASGAPAFAPSELQDVPRGMSSSGADARPIDSTRSFIPDFAQPDDDDKYFKQLKKF